MRLDPFIRDYEKFTDDLVKTLQAPNTRFYLDTSVLMWVIRLGGKARSDFLNWCRSRPKGSVRVPVWAGHELHRHLIRKSIATNVKITVSETEKRLDEFFRLAVERADDVACLAKGYPGRSAYVATVQQTVSRLRELAKIAGDDATLSLATDEVLDFVNDNLLETELAPIIEALGRTGEFRYSHLMPPGYHDDKPENKFGDVVIWEEMLSDAAVDQGDTPFDIVLISRDEKTDWVSSAPLIRNGEGKIEKSNRDREYDVTLAHPLLIHEFAKKTGATALYVVPPGFLASALHYSTQASDSSAVSEWFAASHRSDLLERLATSIIALKPSVAKVGPKPTTSERPTEQLSSQALDKPPSLAELMAISVTAEVSGYPSTKRSEMVASWIADVVAGRLSALRLGRIFAALIIADPANLETELFGILEHLFGALEPKAWHELVLGLVCPAYFDSSGDALTRPRRDLATVALLIEADVRSKPAFDWLTSYLDQATIELPYRPGSGRRPVHFHVDLLQSAGGKPQMLRDIRVGSQPVFIDPLSDNSERSFSTLFGRGAEVGCTGQELRALISKEFSIPQELLKKDWDNKKLIWPPSAGLVSVDTHSAGGLSALAEEEDKDFG
jgi:hypothetical protein